jgi:predicted patatin/cPLA2 family phospholipase
VLLCFFFRRVLDDRERDVQEAKAYEAEVQRRYQQASRDLLSAKKELKKVQTEIEQLEKKQKVIVGAFFCLYVRD